MIITSLLLDDNLEEQLPKAAEAFPYLACYVEMDKYPGKVIPWHWHSYVEFIYVLQGSVRLSTNSQCHVISAGEGAFINSNMLHYQEPAPGLAVITLNQLLDAGLIAGAYKSIYEQKYVRPVLECRELEALHFCLSDPMQRETLDRIRRSYEAADRETAGYEFMVRSELSQAWFLLSQMMDALQKPYRLAGSQGEERIKKMLLFIHEHYDERLSLERIAAAASISERECLRCFSQNLNTTPFTCLLEYRVRKAAADLQKTDRTVTEIAYSCGFSGASYFGRIFRRIMGCTPSEYRKLFHEKHLDDCLKDIRAGRQPDGSGTIL